jgi:hypothetical protein
VVTRILWGGLVFSVGLTIGVRVYVSKEEARWARALNPSAEALEPQTDTTPEGASAAKSGRSGVGTILTESPAGPAAANALRLSWEDIRIAAEFRLGIRTVAGDVILDRLPVQETAWSPPIEVLPALKPGEYLWQVEAVDRDGKVLARSKPERFRIG